MIDMIDGGDLEMQCLAAIGENGCRVPGLLNQKIRATSTPSGTPNLQRAMIAYGHGPNCASRTWIKHKVYLVTIGGANRDRGGA